MITRIVPQSMQTRPPEVVSSTASKETARVENVNLNMCPVCGNMMIQAVANGKDVKLCPDHNIVMPIKDE